MRRVACLLLSSAAFSMFGVPCEAIAQDSTSDQELGISDIVVTAQRRAEANQTVPISITAFSSEKLNRNNVTQAQDLNGLVPSLVIGANGQGSRDTQSPTLRGQGATFQASPAVVLYMNEVPLPAATTLSQQGGAGNYIDLENVQVLAGPQGTLFGRNTTGGAMLLVPKKPVDQFEAYAETNIGNYNLLGLEGMVNIPLVDDRLMVRAVAAYRDRNGFTEDLVWNKRRDDTHWYSGRIGITAKPIERLTNYFMAYGSKSKNNGSGIVHNGFNVPYLQAVGLCQDGPSIPFAIASCEVYERQSELAAEIGPRKTRLGVDQFQVVKTWGVSNTTDFELTDELTIRNIVSFQRFIGDYSYDSDGTPLQQNDQNPTRYPDFPVAGLSEFGLPELGFLNTPSNPYPRDNLKQFTEELQLQGNLLDDKLIFTLGGFYFDQKPVGMWDGPSIVFCPAAFTGLPITGTTACGAQHTRTTIANRSTALYAQGTLDFGVFSDSLDSFRITAGLRSTWDRTKGYANSFTPIEGSDDIVCGATAETVAATDFELCAITAKLKSRASTWTIGADYKPSRELLVYGKISRGYKSGGFNSYAVRPETTTFAPERLTTYEVGFKSDFRLSSMPVRLNAAYYYSDYQNVQTSSGDTNLATGAAGAQVLSASASVQGFEAELTVRPTHWLELSGNLSHTHGKYKHYQSISFVPTRGCNGAVPAGGVLDSSCNDMQYITPWIYGVGGNVMLPVPEHLGAVSFYANYSYRSSQNTISQPLPEFMPGGVLEPYGLLNMSLDWKNVGGSNLDLGLFGTNVTNKLFRISATNLYNTVGVQSSLYGEPRMYGFKLRYSFGS